MPKKSYLLIFKFIFSIFFICLFSLSLFSNKLNLESGNYKSQFGQDKYTNEKFFKNKKNGIFVEIGAYNGISLSNTYFFEKELGWHGICVEPMENAFKQLKKNRNCICIQACISNFDGIATFAEVSSPSSLSGLVDKLDPRHKERIEREIAKTGGFVKYYDMQCYTPKTIFEKFDIHHIDFLSIDTEGGEFDILQSIDFSKMDIDVITVEVNYKDYRIYNFLISHNYKLITKLGCDELYKKIT